MDILIIDDEPKMKTLIAQALKMDGHDVQTGGSLSDALAAIENRAFDLVITDLKMESDESGVEVLKEVKSRSPETDVILITGYATIEVGARALELGAYDYLIKPLKMGDLRNRVSDIGKKKGGMARRAAVAGSGSRALVFDDIVVGTNPKMQKVYEMLPRIVGNQSTILIRGESGTGKEVIARAIHKSSPRRGGAFVEVNCAALVDSLLESELFGIEKRVATGVDSRAGKFEQAAGGTLFLDEIGDMSLATQAKVLRAMQSRRIERVGGTGTIDVDVRLVAATHVNLEKAVAEGRFREDLYYRLNVITVEIPPLRERSEDIRHFVDHFITRFNAQTGKGIEGVDEEAIRTLQNYGWPGNVRELENTIERAFFMSRSKILGRDDFPAQASGKDHVGGEEHTFLLPDGGIKLEEVERDLLVQALRRTDGNRTRAAELLGLTRRVLGYRLEKYKIDGNEDPRKA